MNLTSLALANGTPKYDENATPQDVAVESQQLTMGPVPVPKSKPTISLLRDAMDAFNVKGTARLVAYELLTYWRPGGAVFPSLATLADGLGVDARTVRTHLARLERIGLWVRVGRIGRTNLYQLRLPGPDRTARTPDPTIPPPGSYDPPEVTNQVTKVHTPRARVSCAIHGREWFKADGQRCFECAHERMAVGAKRTPRKPRGGMPTYHERPAREFQPMTAAKTADAEDLALTRSWQQQGDGSWRKW